jgi:hypothetical protein
LRGACPLGAQRRSNLIFYILDCFASLAMIL